MIEEDIPYFWLSFAAPDRFLGGCCVQGETLKEAIVNSHLLGINPGGEVRGIGPVGKSRIPPSQILNKLLTLDEIVEPVKWPTTHQSKGER